jgi:glycine/serine hydroxymethyltransferase
MRLAAVVFAALAFAQIASARCALAQTGDDVCPSAASAVAAYRAVARGRPNDERAVVRTARDAAAAFQRCGDRARRARNDERLAGADVREAAYRVTLGTTLYELSMRGEARAAFVRAMQAANEAIATAKTMRGPRAAQLLREARTDESRARDAIETVDGAR